MNCHAPRKLKKRPTTIHTGRNPVVGKTALRHLKRLGRLWLAALLTVQLIAGPALAELPTGGVVSAGGGSIAGNAADMVVTQSSDRLAIDWQSFNIGRGNSVTFAQPSATSVALNRVLGSDVSTIQGALNANGQVFLLNPNGVLFSPTAQVEVGGLVASTLNLSNEDFLAGRYSFSGDSSAGVTNQGTITAAQDGTVALIAARIVNEGNIDAPGGSVLLGSGNRVTLDLGGSVKLSVEQGTLDGLIEQGGAIRADGGLVYLTAKAADTLSSSVINHTGLTRAQTLTTGEQGEIVLLGDMHSGTVNLGGTLDASAPNGGDGGFIETSAAHVHVANDARVTTLAANGANGTWLIDPDGFTIAASGGDITGTQLSTNLNGGNIAIASTGGSGADGNVNVNDSVTWSANKLTLTATNDINIAADLNGSGTASLALEYGQGAVAAGNAGNYNLSNGASVSLPAGNSFSTTLGNDVAATTWTVITSLGTSASSNDGSLQGMAGDLDNASANYALGANIDASATSGWNAGAGFTPVGSFQSASQFSGDFAGLGHTITGLTINRPDTWYVGLFGNAMRTGGSPTLRDVGLLDSSITGYGSVGVLAGSDVANISNCYATGSVSGYGTYVGGLVGGGTGTVSNSYAAVNVTGTDAVGGLMGGSSATVSNSYATGSVSGTTGVGGLVGFNHHAGTVSNSYATGSVTGTTDVGGLVGYNSGAAATVSNSFWNSDIEAAGVGTNTGTFGATGKTTAELQTLATFSGAGWSIDDASGTGATWRIYDGYTYPLLRSFLTPLTVTPAFDGGGTAMTAIGTVASGGYDASKVFGAAGTLSLSSTAADGYTATLGGNGLYSSQLGYDITLGSRTISTPGSAAGDIVLNNPIRWSSGTLAIDTTGTITDTAALSGTGSAVFDLQSGNWSQVNTTLPAFDVYDFRLSGGSFLRALDGDGSAGTPYRLADIYGMEGMGSSGMLGLNYALANDIAASGTANWNGGAGFAPVGTLATQFTGNFDGLGHTIDGLTINRLTTEYVGLFGYATGTLRDVGLLNSNVRGQSVVGALAGYSSNTIEYVYASGGSVTADRHLAGGLVGQIGGSIDYSYANVAVKGNSNGVSTTGIGGLVGQLVAGGSISNSYATGSVNGGTGTDVGGLVGQARGGTVTDSYATGAVSGTTYAGGLAGSDGFGGTSATFTNCYWDTTTSGKSGSFGGTGLTTAQMQTMASFSGWDIDAAGGSGKVWRIYDGQSYPLLRNFLAPLTVTANDAGKTYDGTAYSGGNGVSYSVTPNGSLLGTPSYGGSSQGAINAGSYVISPSGFYSTSNLGYDISYADGALTVNPAALTISGNDATRTYDATAYAGGNGVSYSGFVNSETASVLGGTLTYGGTAQGAVNAGSYAITPSGLTAANYAISFVDGSLTIDPASLTLGTGDVTKTYDGTTAAAGTAIVTGGTLYGSDTISGGSFAFTDPNAGSGKTVTVSNVSVNDGNGGNNYTVSYADNTSSTIDPAALTVTANNAGKVFDGLAYSGGNGVSYSGFVDGEDETVLGGSLSYGGDAQGAIDEGSYAIAPSGLTASNYSLSFVDGVLTIAPMASFANLPAPARAAMEDASGRTAGPFLRPGSPAGFFFVAAEEAAAGSGPSRSYRIQLVGGGIHLPE